MKKPNKKLTNAALLRKKAEEQLKSQQSKTSLSFSEPDLLKLIHELEVHQIELEMQNEELVLAKEKAEQAEEKYTELYDFAPSGYISLSKKGEILELNFAAARILGKERTKLIKKQFDFFVSINTQLTFNLFLHEVFTSKLKQTCEVIVATEGNLPIYVNIDGIVSLNNELCLLTLIDITERKSAERNLLEEKEHVEVSENKYRTLAENSPAIIYRILLKPSFKFEYVSPVVTEVTGYTPEDHYADPDLGFKMVHPDDRMILEKTTTQKTQGEPTVLRWVKKDGKIVWTEQRNVLIIDTEGNPFAIEGIAVDITLQKEAELALHMNKDLLNASQRLSKTGGWEWNVETQTMYWTEETYRIHDLTPSSVKPEGSEYIRLSSECYRPEDRPVILDAFQRCQEEGQPYDLEFPFTSVKGRQLWIRTIAEPVIENGKSIRIIGNIIDITGRKKAEEALRKSEDRLHTAREAILDSFLIFSAERDEQGNISDFIFTDINANAEKMLQLTSRQLIGKRMCEELPINRTNGFFEKYRNVVETGIPLEEEFYLPDTHVPAAWYYHQVVKCGDGIAISHRDISERKQAEEKIIKTGQHYQALIEKAPDGIALIDARGNFRYISPAAKKMFGYALTDEISGNPAEYTHPDDLQMVLSELEKIFEDPTYVPTLEYRFIDKLGQWHWIETTFSNLLANPNVESIVLNFHDITEHKLSVAMFKDIIEKNPMSIQILDMEGYPIQVNPAHTKLFGVEPPSGYSLFKDNQLLSLGFSKLFERVKQGEIVYFPDSYYNVHDVDPSFPDSPAWVRAFGFTLNDNNGKPNKIVLMHENITERKNAEALLNDIIENNPLSIQVVDKEGYTIRGNSAFIDLFGSAPPPEFSIFDDLKSKSPDLGKLVSRVKKGEIAHLPDIYFNAHDAIEEAPDIPLWIRALIFPLKDSVGKPERFVFMHENITERKIAEQELITAKEHAEESDRLKSAFLANMSHEIRTPMNGILGFSELLKNPGLTGKQQQEYIGIIEKSGIRMLDIINDIVDISKIEAGLMNVNIRETDINEKIEFIYMFFKPQVEEKGMQLQYKNTLPRKEAIIKTDNEKVNSILTNLVKNAIKFSEKGSIEFGYEQKENDLEFYVKDTGIGIPKERQEAIFERFIQADISDKMARQGAGLGLSISKAYVEMLGGRIWVESEEGKGTTFYFTLPYNTGPDKKETSEKSVSAQNETNQIIPGVPQLKTVIAEDDETSELLISINIKEFSKEIIKVRTGNEVVEVCRNNPDIDLILMDIQMPGMNGYEATRLIRQFNPNVIIIAQTAFGLTGDKEKAIDAGCNDHIAKPISKDELIVLIHKYFMK
ncbi:MAG: PAS domain S-box protein [Bacteroidales bacterium]|nr:PAS domain S-box protein [Bacteroidales bacterium]